MSGSAEIYPREPVLVIDDEPEIIKAMRSTLMMSGITNIVSTQRSADVSRLLAKGEFSVITLDLSMPEVSGRSLIPELLTKSPRSRIIVVTGHHELETAVECMRLGAYDYLTKPVDHTRLTTSLKRAIEIWEADFQIDVMKRKILNDHLDNPQAFARIHTTSRSMLGLFRYAEAIAKTSFPVLITGETGTGKELLARAIHDLSGRNGELVTVNAGGLDDAMLSDTLFGHVPGAYTGAQTQRIGMIRQAEGGTFFLDEIGDLSRESQVKLLRLIQQKEYFPLGSDRAQTSSARFIFATNVDLERAVGQKSFRPDLYFRLRTHRLHAIPLRERSEDIGLLAGHFIRKACEETGIAPPPVPEGLYKLLENYDFPGNVRELEGLITDAVIRSREGVSLGNAVERYLLTRGTTQPPVAEDGWCDRKGIFSDMETLPTLKTAADALVDEAMRRSGGNQSSAARFLGISRTALNKRLSRRREVEANRE